MHWHAISVYTHDWVFGSLDHVLVDIFDNDLLSRGWIRDPLLVLLGMKVLIVMRDSITALHRLLLLLLRSIVGRSILVNLLVTLPLFAVQSLDELVHGWDLVVTRVMPSWGMLLLVRHAVRIKSKVSVNRKGRGRNHYYFLRTCQLTRETGLVEVL